MRALTALVLSMTLASMTLWASPVTADTPLPDGPHVVANGSGKVVAAPDMAEITVISAVNNPSAAQAKQRVDAAVNDFLRALHQHGVVEADIEASDLSLREDVDAADDGRRVSNGYDAQRSVTFKLRAIDKLNSVLDAALSAGMNRLGETRFTSSRADSLRAEARARAARNATERARELAAGFNAQLGNIYSINSANNDLSTRHRYGANSLDSVVVTGSAAAPGRYLKPEIEFNESVTAVFTIQP